MPRVIIGWASSLAVDMSDLYVTCDIEGLAPEVAEHYARVASASRMLEYKESLSMCHANSATFTVEPGQPGPRGQQSPSGDLDLKEARLTGWTYCSKTLTLTLF